jgi:hypothetical protein
MDADQILANHDQPIETVKRERAEPESEGQGKRIRVEPPRIIPVREFDLRRDASFGKKGDGKKRFTDNNIQLVDMCLKEGDGVIRVSFGECLSRNFGVEKSQYGTRLTIQLKDEEIEAFERINQQFVELCIEHKWLPNAKTVDQAKIECVFPTFKRPFKNAVSATQAKNKKIEEYAGDPSGGYYPATVSCIAIDDEFTMIDTEGVPVGPHGTDEKNYFGVNGVKFAEPPVFTIKWVYFKDRKVGLRIKPETVVIDRSSLVSAKDRDMAQRSAATEMVRSRYSRSADAVAVGGADVLPWEN